MVAAAALEEGLYRSVDQQTRSPDPYVVPGTASELTNEKSSRTCENVSLRDAFRYSCDTVFAKLAVDLGESRVRRMAEKFGFDKEMFVPVRAGASTYPREMNEGELALSGIGQHTVQATPLQMAMVSSTLANGGELVTPRSVSKLTDSQGKALESFKPATERVVSEETAAELRKAMVGMVTAGKATSLGLGGVVVGGTAAVLSGQGDARGTWYTTYAQRGTGGHSVAVTVVVRGTADTEKSDADTAALTAKTMMEAALRTSDR